MSEINETKRLPWAIWEVDGEEYKLKLTTAAIDRLEQKYKVNLLNFMMNGGMPPLSVMMDITHAAMQKFNHGKKLSDVQELFDKYLDEGGSQIEFLTKVFIPIYQASGFFSPSQANEMSKKMEDTDMMI